MRRSKGWVLLAALVAASASGSTGPTKDPQTIVAEEARRAGAPPSLLLAICDYESAGFNNLIVPHDGADDLPSYGICQLKEGTARQFGFKGVGYTGATKRSKGFPHALVPAGKPNGLMVVRQNARYAARYLRYQLEQHEGDWCRAVSAYNSGTYRPSARHPGKPRNYRYVKRILLHLDEAHRDLLLCGAREIPVE